MPNTTNLGRIAARFTLAAGLCALTLAVAPTAGAGPRGGHGTQHAPSHAGRDHADVSRLLVPPYGKVAGRTTAEWAADLWQWTFSFLEGESPVFDDETGELAYLGDVGGPVFFAAAASNVRRSFDVPCGKYMLVPLVDQAWTLEGDDTEAFARQQNAEFLATVSSLVARLDGKRIPDLYSYVQSSPSLFTVTIPDGGLFGPEGGTFQAVTAGYFLMIKPLPRGPHSLVFGATALDGAFDYRARFDFRVVGPCPRS